jgi:hypothetical protein
MDYTHIPEALLYKRKSVDKFAMLHPLNAEVLKRLIRMKGWDKKYSKEIQILPCMNNAYYICTIMRLEYDATFREDSYKSIARERYYEGSHTFKECVTLSLVVLLIEHSATEWRQKLKEVSDDLLQYVYCLYEERTNDLSSVFDSEILDEDLLKGIPSYLLKDLDDSWVLPDDLFNPRALDEKAIYDLHRQAQSFNWDKYVYHHDEDDIHEMVEKLGQTQQEKAILIRSFWKDIYYSRKKFDGPIKDTWLFLKTLAQEFCPEYMEKTELHKIPETGVEFEKRISELEDEVTRLEQKLGNVNSEVSSELETQVKEQQAARIKELEAEVEELKRKREIDNNNDWVVELFSHFCYEDVQVAQDIINEMRDKTDPEIANIIYERRDKKKEISTKTSNIDMWRVLHAAKIYESDSYQNLNTALQRRKKRKQ